jgi:hypothetical protein
MKQQTLTGFERYGKTTRRAQFLADMQEVSAALANLFLSRRRLLNA